MAGGVALLLAGLFAVIALVGLGIWANLHFTRKRQEAFRLLASVQGWTYATDGSDPSPRFPGFRPFGEGHSRAARDLLAGRANGQAFEAFTYRYVVTSGAGKSRHETTHWYEVVVLPMPIAAPRLALEPETLGHKLFDALGGEDIDFESDEFSRAYWVKGEDRRFAYDVVSPAMMEHLLAGDRHLAFQWQGTVLVACKRGKLDPTGAAALVQHVAKIPALLPRHLLSAPPASPPAPPPTR
jgi:hypothetical protein